MKLNKSVPVIVAGACVILALLTVFAIELSDTQANSKSGIETQVHGRSVLAAALISGLFQSSVQSSETLLPKQYGTATVSSKALTTQAGQGGYAVLLDGSGNVLAASAGFTAEAQAELPKSAALTIIRSGKPYGLGNIDQFGSTGIIDFAEPFTTPYGTRTLVTGFTPNELNAFITAELAQIPGVKGALNYLLDGNDIVLASTNTAAPVGRVIPGAGEVQALSKPSGQVGDRYFDQATIANSTWRIVLTAPAGPLFATVTGWHEAVPWLVFAAFALVAIVALALAYGVMRSSDEVRTVNEKLEVANQELVGVNDALERRAAELARSNEELDQFASIASHDLQEPLRKVRTFTEQVVATEGEQLSERARDYLGRANSAAERMQTLIEDLLRFSRVSTKGRPFEPVDLGEITREVLVDLSTQVEESAASVQIGELPTVPADALQMRQLMQNLISNALKFRREGVPLEVSIAAVADAGMVRLSVHDNGIGFDPRYHLRIFRVFERLHGRDKYPGTGIGLALSRKIVERHGGQIIAEGEPGVGSTFTITLPLRHDDGTPPATELHSDDEIAPSERAHVNA